MKERKITETEYQDMQCELKQPIWSIVAPEKVLMVNLTYPQAEQKMLYLEDITGATIVTNETALRQELEQKEKQNN
jgi:hypothetical protein